MSIETDYHERNVRQYLGRCRHFTGWMQEVCEAGHNYSELNGGNNRGVAIHLPCLHEHWDGSIACPSVAYIEREEAEARVARNSAAIKAWTDKITAHVCPSCNETFKGKQVGPCVYCEHCGARLWQGRLQP